MRSIFEPLVLTDTLNRIEQLQPSNQRQWGKMDPAQMLAHCCATMEVASGRTVLPRLFIGRILGPFFKSAYLGEKPFPQDSPTDKSFIVSDARDFSREKSRLLTLVKAFSEGGEKNCTTHPHPFFGRLAPNEWGIGMYKHLDHHLRQFGC
jgi:hypothetical protein